MILFVISLEPWAREASARMAVAICTMSSGALMSRGPEFLQWHAAVSARQVVVLAYVITRKLVGFVPESKEA